LPIWQVSSRVQNTRVKSVRCESAKSLNGQWTNEKLSLERNTSGLLRPFSLSLCECETTFVVVVLALKSNAEASVITSAAASRKVRKSFWPLLEYVRPRSPDRSHIRASCQPTEVIFGLLAPNARDSYYCTTMYVQTRPPLIESLLQKSC
jgi:hypothetical protein